jgi:hypothetical protein
VAGDDEVTCNHIYVEKRNIRRNILDNDTCSIKTAGCVDWQTVSSVNLCHPLYFACPDGGCCVPLNSLCDGYKDCTDDADESLCADEMSLINVLNKSGNTLNVADMHWKNVTLGYEYFVRQ